MPRIIINTIQCNYILYFNIKGGFIICLYVIQIIT